MLSTPQSPTSPRTRRMPLRLSSFDTPSDASPSPYTSGTTNGSTAYSRRSSRTSQTSYQPVSPITPRPMSSRSSRPPSFHDRQKSSSRLSIGSNFSLDQVDNGLGNLADELEDALDDEYEGRENSYMDATQEGTVESVVASPQSVSRSKHVLDMMHDESTDDAVAQPHGSIHSLDPQSARTSKAEKRKSRHKKTDSKYDGSDYGPESDPEEDGFPPLLAKRFREIETVVRMSLNTEDALSEDGGVVKRTISSLKDLGPQANIETSLSRIITAYTSMTMHRTHKTRELFSQAHSLLYGNNIGLPEDLIDVLLSELQVLASTIPVSYQQQNPLQSLQILASQTVDLAHTLQSLSDVLQESRIQSNTATRKLKTVKDMVDEMNLEQELTETSVMLIQAGDWDRRCRERQAAATCREVVAGFGERWGLEIEERPWITTREGEKV